MLAIRGLCAPGSGRLAATDGSNDEAMVARFQSRERGIRSDRRLGVIRRRGGQGRQGESEEECDFPGVDFHDLR